MFNIFGKTAENFEHIFCDQLEDILKNQKEKNNLIQGIFPMQNY
jgi:hypothetical protein